MSKKGRIERIDEGLANDLKSISIFRIKKGLENDKISCREITRMMRNAESYPNLLNELKTKPRRKC